MSLEQRVRKLEQADSDKSVVGVTSARGVVDDIAGQERLRKRIDELRAVGRTVYFANLSSGRRWGAIEPTVPERRPA